MKVIKIVVLLCLLQSTWAQGNELVEFANPVHLRNIRGVVVDNAGGIIPGAKIELLAISDHKVVESTITDAQGRFEFNDRGIPSRFGLRASKLNFDIVQYTIVRTWHGRGELKIVLPVAT